MFVRPFLSFYLYETICVDLRQDLSKRHKHVIIIRHVCGLDLSNSFETVSSLYVFQ